MQQHNSEFNVSWVAISDFNELAEWWGWWRFPAPAPEMLPIRISEERDTFNGVKISKDGINICAGFIYNTNSSIAWMEYIVSNPNYRESDRDDALQYLILRLGMLANEKGYAVIYTSLNNEHLIKHYEKVGFIKGSKTTEMVLSLL